MAYDNNFKFSGWIRTSKAGNKFISGLFELDGKKYQLNIMKQQNKKSEKSPDYWGKIEPAGKPEESDAPF